MLYVGVDQHKNFSQVAVMDKNGRVLDNRRLYHNARDEMREYFRSLKDEFSVAFEATRNWYWLCDLLEEEAKEVKMAHPAKVRLIADAKVKTDKIDAVVLAQLDRTGFLPKAHIPAKEVRDRRETHRFRMRLVKMSTGLKNTVHSVLGKLGIECRDGDNAISDIFGKKGREFLKALELPNAFKIEVEMCLHLIDCIKAEIEQLKEELKKTLSGDKRAEWVMSVPGIGEILAYLILYEVGEIDRFPSSKRFASYCGLAPRTRQSAEHLWQGSVGREGNVYLKWAFVEASHKDIQKDPYLKMLYESKKREKGGAKATVCIARHLAVSVYSMLKKGENYRYMDIRKGVLGKPVCRLGRS